MNMHQSLAPGMIGNQAQPELRSRRALLAIGALFVLMLLAAAFVPIGGAVIATGQLGVETRVKRIAHPTGGVISALLVRDGSRVRAGDVLARLDTTVAGARADLSSRTVSQLLAQRARLEAEREERPFIRFPPAMLASDSAETREALAAETRLFRLRRDERSMLRAQLGQRIAQEQRQIAGYQAQIDSLRKQQVLIEPERAGVQKLWDKGLVTITRRNQLERTAADLEGTIASLQAAIAQTEAKIIETRQQIVQLNQSSRSQAASELAEANESLNERQVEQVSATDAYARSDIRAPHDGVVDKLAFGSVGEVVQPAQTIMEIVPDSDRLIIEARVSPADVDQVKTGQHARVRFTTYSGALTPQIAGKVTFVSAERTTEKESGTSFYRIHIELDAAALHEQRLDLIPGMPVETFISTGSRAMLSYLTKPLTDQFARAFRN